MSDRKGAIDALKNKEMKKKWNILIVSYIDDNYGDILIRICFEQLLRVVLKNLNVSDESVQISRTSIKNVDEKLVCSADIIAFSGGGLFGLSYLGFYEGVSRIIELADQNDIPVILSSMGFNNMDANADNEHLIRELFQKKCIKALSVRENLPLFRRYAGGGDFEICQVCDPAVWTKYVYATRLPQPLQTHSDEIIGINVVRGGLFKDNDIPWNLGDELRYLDELRQELDKRGLRYLFYTNGSFLDDNTLHYFADQYDIPDERLVFPMTTSEWVGTVAQFDRVASIRMHSSIVSYALSIPSVNLIWNKKIPFFYEYIGYPERALDVTQWNGSAVFEMLEQIKEQPYPLNEEYLMSLYRYLYRVMRMLLPTQATEEDVFHFAAVTKELCGMSVSDEEDGDNLRFKLNKGERQYLLRFKELREQECELKQLRKAKKELDRKNKEIEKLKIKLQRLNRLPSVRLARLLRRVIRKLQKR